MVVRVTMVAGVQGKARGWPFQASHAHNQASHLVAGLLQNLDAKIADFGIQDIFAPCIPAREECITKGEPATFVLPGLPGFGLSG